MTAKRIIIGDQEIRIPDKLIKLGALGAIPLVGIVLVIWLLTGVYSVGPDEVGVIRTFGKVSRIAQPGLSYHLPYPIEVRNTPKVTEVKRIAIGFRSLGNGQFRTIEK